MKRIVKIFILTIVSFNILIPCYAEDTNAYDFEQFFAYFYVNPSPNSLSVVLEDFLNSDMWPEKSFDEHAEYLTAYFFARASKSESDILENYKNLFESGTHEQRLFMLKVLRFCGNQDVKNFLISKLDNEEFANESEQINNILEEDIPIDFNPLTDSIETAGDLDFLWVEFMVTGNKEAVIKIINTLAYDLHFPKNRLLSGQFH